MMRTCCALVVLVTLINFSALSDAAEVNLKSGTICLTYVPCILSGGST